MGDGGRTAQTMQSPLGSHHVRPERSGTVTLNRFVLHLLGRVDPDGNTTASGL